MLSVSQVWWLTPVIPALRGLRQENQEFEASLGYIARCCLKRKKGRKNAETGARLLIHIISLLVP
jgi:hypothetical protein